MPKLTCRVVGHEIKKRGELEMVQVKLVSPEGLRCTFLVATEEADHYPRGCEATLGFSIQQSLPLEPSEGGRKQDDKSSRRARGQAKERAPRGER